ncbi:hypothetical protein BSKO_09025 [Bryopsis sp. KO-2023]|nr:hypothetical protein BSKO_09025 [Bryopsis sp. KO-2023]
MQPREEVSVDDALVGSVGEFGHGQARIYLLTNLIWLISALQVYSMIFVETDPVFSHNWRCRSNDDELCVKLSGLAASEKLQIQFCNLERDRWEWTHRGRSIVSDFELQCQEWRVGLVRLLFFAGQFLGSGLVGYASDKIGRRKGLLLSIGMSGFGTLVGAFAPNYWVYCAARFATGLGFGGQVVAAFVLWTEFVGPSKRGKLGIATQLLFVVGQCLLVLLAYVIPGWRTLSLIIACCTISFFLAWVWLPESPRWWLSKGKKGDATSVLAAVASANKKKLPEMPLREIAQLGNTDRLLWEVVKSRKLRRSLVIILAIWFSVCVIYYGVPLMLEQAPGSMHLNFMLAAIVELPAYILCILLVDRVGRKPIFVWGFFVGAVCCLSLVIAPNEFVLPFVVISKFSTSSVFAVAFVYTTETFPTSVRATCLGLASLSARLGGVLTHVAIGILGAGLSLVVFGALGLFAGMVALGLPETMGTHLPDAVEVTTAPKRHQMFEETSSLTLDVGQPHAPGRWFRWGRKKASLTYSRFDDVT